MTGYQLLDFGSGTRLENWAGIRIKRPDSAALGAVSLPDERQNVDAIWKKQGASGIWELTRDVPRSWQVSIGDWMFEVGFGASKQLGVFPEQLEQWQLVRQQCQDFVIGHGHAPNVLNLFAFTGAATIAAASGGGVVTHVDSNYAAIGRARRNRALNGLAEDTARWIKDDVLQFVRRELRRGKKYQLILLDPPPFGHGAGGEQFSFRRDIPQLLQLCDALLAVDAIGIICTVYSNHLTPTQLSQLLRRHLNPRMTIASAPLLLETDSGNTLTTGSWAYCRPTQA